MDPSGGSVQVTLVRTEVVLFFFFFFFWSVYPHLPLVQLLEALWAPNLPRIP